MRKRRPHVASMDEVRISRDGEYAVIEFADDSIQTTRLRIGPELGQMSDEEVLAAFNDNLHAREQVAASYHHVAVEIPFGRPQIEYAESGHHWIPRGDVLRCAIEDHGLDEDPVICIDDKELSWRDFGQLLKTYAGWGMRVTFVPDDELHEEPTVEVREPDAHRR